MIISTWFWGQAYSIDYIRKCAAGMKRHLVRQHRFVVVTDAPDAIRGLGLEAIGIPREDRHLLSTRGCFARLRMFDPAWQHEIGFRDDVLVNVDCDSIFLRPLDPLFERPESFVILQGGNAANPCPYNGALMLLTPGVNSHVWNEFSMDAASRVPFYEFPDDQGWIADRVPGAAAWRCGHQSGVYVFRKPGWPANSEIAPADARLVTFVGKRRPDRLTHLRWVQENW